jgi:tetratricopeptide (TPR) repeat protein
MKQIKAPLFLLLVLVLTVVLAVSCASKPSYPEDPLFRQADEQMQAQNYSVAIQTYQRIRDKYPDTIFASQAEENIAGCYYIWSERLMYPEQDYEAALEKLQIVAEQYSHTEAGRTVINEDSIPSSYLRWAGYLMYPEHNYQSAVEKYEFLIAQYPQSDYAVDASEAIPACYREWGDYLSREDNYLGSIEKYEILLSEYPDSEPTADLIGEKGEYISRAYYKVAEQQWEEGDYDAAIDSYQAILERWPQSTTASSAGDNLPKVYLAKASELEQEERWGEAFDIYQMILTQFPEFDEAFDVKFDLLPQCAYEYGRLLQSQGRYKEAIKEYEISGTAEAIEALPECYYLSVQHLAEEGKYREALDNYITVLNDYPDSIWASWEKGEILDTIPADYLYERASELGTTENARRLYMAVLDYHPESDYIELVDLIEAERRGLAEVAAFGAGSLDRILLTLTSNSEQALRVAILPGMIFNSQSASIQSMLVLTEKLVFLIPHERIESIKVDAACGNMQLDLPGKSDSLTLSLSPTSGDLMELLSLPDFQEETTRVRQFAIWTITDNPGRHDYMGIATGFQIFGTGPSDEEIGRIRALFEKSGIPTNKYKALS